MGWKVRAKRRQKPIYRFGKESSGRALRADPHPRSHRARERARDNSETVTVNTHTRRTLVVSRKRLKCKMGVRTKEANSGGGWGKVQINTIVYLYRTTDEGWYLANGWRTLRGWSAWVCLLFTGGKKQAKDAKRNNRSIYPLYIDLPSTPDSHILRRRRTKVSGQKSRLFTPFRSLRDETEIRKNCCLKIGLTQRDIRFLVFLQIYPFSSPSNVERRNVFYPRNKNISDV